MLLHYTVFSRDCAESINAKLSCDLGMVRLFLNNVGDTKERVTIRLDLEYLMLLTKLFMCRKRPERNRAKRLGYAGRAREKVEGSRKARCQKL